jgi:hypothetical protein
MDIRDPDISAEAQLRRRLEQRYGAKPSKGSLIAVAPPPGEPDPQGKAPASDALRWVRGEHEETSLD